jgi:hypothetical protein
MKTYLTHFNGGRPYQVDIDGNNSIIVKKPSAPFGYYSTIHDEVVYSYTNPKKIFIGKSPKNKMTKFSAGFGKAFDGNSILVNTIDNNYVYIGKFVASFYSKYPIVKYVSPVGNNDVPYAYAKDTRNNVYLMIENTIILRYTKRQDPYDYFYRESYIVKYVGPVITEQDPRFVPFGNITGYFNGKDSYNLKYHPFPEEEYDRVTEDFKEKLYITTTKDDMKQQLYKKDYIQLIHDFGKHMGFEPLKFITIDE